MKSGIKLTSDEMRYIALFERITRAAVRDCIIDDGQKRIICLVKEGDGGLAIGKHGKNMRTLERMTGKKHEVIEYSENPVRFLKNAFKPARVREIRITDLPSGKTLAVVTVNPRDKGVAIGKNGRKADMVRFLAKRYFQIDDVSIT